MIEKRGRLKYKSFYVFLSLMLGLILISGLANAANLFIEREKSGQATEGPLFSILVAQSAQTVYCTDANGQKTACRYLGDYFGDVKQFDPGTTVNGYVTTCTPAPPCQSCSATTQSCTTNIFTRKITCITIPNVNCVGGCTVGTGGSPVCTSSFGSTALTPLLIMDMSQCNPANPGSYAFIKCRMFVNSPESFQQSCQEYVNGNPGASSPKVWLTTTDSATPNRCCESLPDGSYWTPDQGYMVPLHNYVCDKSPYTGSGSIEQKMQWLKSTSNKGVVDTIEGSTFGKPFDVVSIGPNWVSCVGVAASSNYDAGVVVQDGAQVSIASGPSYLCSVGSSADQFAGCCASMGALSSGGCNNPIYSEEDGTSNVARGAYGGLRKPIGATQTAAGKIFYCAHNAEPGTTAPTIWTTDLDAYSSSDACNKAGFVWTGSKCCGDNVSETYNEGPYTDFSGVIWNVCYQSKLVRGGELFVDPTYTKPLMNFNGMLYGCNLNGAFAADIYTPSIGKIVNVHSCTSLGERFCDPSGIFSSEPIFSDSTGGYGLASTRANLSTIYDLTKAQTATRADLKLPLSAYVIKGTPIEVPLSTLPTDNTGLLSYLSSAYSVSLCDPTYQSNTEYLFDISLKMNADGVQKYSLTPYRVCVKGAKSVKVINKGVIEQSDDRLVQFAMCGQGYKYVNFLDSFYLGTGTKKIPYTICFEGVEAAMSGNPSQASGNPFDESSPFTSTSISYPEPCPSDYIDGGTIYETSENYQSTPPNQVVVARRICLKGTYAPSVVASTIVTSQGCCPSGFCWEGTTCAADQTSGLVAGIHLFGTDPVDSAKGYMCANGQWKWVEPKFDLLGRPGYCANESQCLISVNSDNKCADSGTNVGQFYCENGEFSSRTKNVVKELLTVASASGSTDFELFCGNYSSVLNDYTYGVRTSQFNRNVLDYLIGSGGSAQFDENGNLISVPTSTACRDQRFGDLYQNMACTNNMCVLKYRTNSDTPYTVAFGLTLNQDVSGALNTGDKYYFQDTIGATCALQNDGTFASNSGTYQTCVEPTGNYVYYNNKTGVLVFSNAQATLGSPSLPIFNSFITTPFADIIYKLKNVIKPVSSISSSISYADAYISQVNRADTVYVSQHGNKYVYAYLEEKPKNEAFSYYLGAKYLGFNSDICTSVQKYDKKISGTNIFNCTKLTGDQYVVSMTLGDSAGGTVAWQDLTAKLRQS